MASKKQIQKQKQKVHIGSAVSSEILNADVTSDEIMFGYPVEKITLVTTGDLLVSVEGIVGQSSIAVGAVTTTIVSPSLSHMIAGLKITRTSGTGQLIILAK